MMNKEHVSRIIDQDIKFYSELMEEIKATFVLDSNKMFDLYHSAESVYVALCNLKKVLNDE